jgi:hypothetical protein
MRLRPLQTKRVNEAHLVRIVALFHSKAQLTLSVALPPFIRLIEKKGVLAMKAKKYLMLALLAVLGFAGGCHQLRTNDYRDYGSYRDRYRDGRDYEWRRDNWRDRRYDDRRDHYGHRW